MAGLVRSLEAILLALCVILVCVSALPSPLRSRRDLGGYDDLQDPGLSQQDMMLLQKLLAPPTKRQLCRSGFTYNPVYGGCRASLGLLRGRGRSGRY